MPETPEVEKSTGEILADMTIKGDSANPQKLSEKGPVGILGAIVTGDTGSE